MRKSFDIGFVIAGVAIGFVAAFQFNATPIAISRFSTTEIEAKDELLKDYLDEQGYLKSKITSLRKAIEDAQVEIEAQTKTSNVAMLDSLKKIIGLTKIDGEGIEITLNDSPYVSRDDLEIKDSDLIQASDIRDIVNILNAAGVDAVSVNKQRVIASSPIVSVGTSVLVNNSHVAPPFVIAAVGDKDLMIQRLLNNSLLDSLYSRRKKSSIEMTIVIKKSLSIPPYNENLNINYIDLVKE